MSPKRNSVLSLFAILALLMIWETSPLRGEDDTTPPDSALKVEEITPTPGIDADTASPAFIDDSAAVMADTAKPDTVIIDPDLYRSDESAELIDIYYRRDTTQTEKPSPTLTLFKSVLFPGWGQYSNRKYIKAGIVFVVESYFIYKAVDYGRKASDWRSKWKKAPDDLKSEYFSKYTQYRDSRNTNLWYTALTIFLSMFDAYVDAHLREFPEDIADREKVSLDIAGGEQMRVAVNYRF